MVRMLLIVTQSHHDNYSSGGWYLTSLTARGSACWQILTVVDGHGYDAEAERTVTGAAFAPLTRPLVS